MSLTCAYCSRSQSEEEFKIFGKNFDILLSQINNEFPICSNVTGDFNAPCTNWLKDNNTNTIQKEIDSLIPSAVYTKIIDKPALIKNNYKNWIFLSILKHTKEKRF